MAAKQNGRERPARPLRPNGVTRTALIAIAIAVAATGCTASSPSDNRSTPPLQPAGTMPWQDALVLPGDPTLITVRFVAGPEGRPSDPCADRFEIDVQETGETVDLTLRELPHATSATSTDAACSLGGAQRYATADLDRPLGSRRLIDGSRGEGRPVVDATNDPARAAVRTSVGGQGDAQLAGSLGVDPASGCLWVEGAAGRIPFVLAHPRYTVQLHTPPLEVIDEGSVPVSAGRQVRLGGATGQADDAVPGCPVPGAPFVGVLQR